MKRTNCSGITMAEICIALMILALGLVSILALFPKALHTSQAIMDTSMGSMVARSAMATMFYEKWEPGHVGPRAAITDDNTNCVLYSWVAFVGPEIRPKLYRVTVSVYGRDFAEMNDPDCTLPERLAAASNYKPVCCFVSARSDPR